MPQELYEDIYAWWFSFGKNWEQFLQHVTPDQIQKAQDYLQWFVWKHLDIAGKTLIDIGCGSGIMSLAYIMLGAKKVLSIDVDTASIGCAKSLREKYNISSEKRDIQTCSILDKEGIEILGKFDIVYSWGVIHHSWDMWRWLANTLSLTHQWSYLYIALYNTCTRLAEWTSTFWVTLKKIYSKHKRTRYIIKPIYTSYLILWLLATGRNPVRYISAYKSFRGMNFFTDIEDRLGWYPYEHATYDAIVSYYSSKWYDLSAWIEVRSIWCNEFLFKKS
jgi:SAM-dependent methyltransferase